MLTKVLIIVGVSVATVIAMFVTGYFLAKAADKEMNTSEKETQPASSDRT